MRLSRAVFALGLGLATLAPVGPVAAEGPNNDDTRRTDRQYDHIFVIVEENTEYSGIIGNPNMPTINALAQKNGLATNYFGTIHPSEGNYVSLVGGDDYGIRDDAIYTTHLINRASIVDQLEAANLSWKGYFQNLPFAGFADKCYPSLADCLYASKHNGFVNFTHVSGNPQEMLKLVPDTNLGDDLASGNVPNFAFIAPDQCHDLHGLSICQDTALAPQLSQETDAYLKSTVDMIMRSDVWQRGRNALVVTFDEGDTNLGCCDGGDDPFNDTTNSGGGHVVTVVIRNHDHDARQDPTPYNHHSLVATLQAAFGLGCTFNGQPVGDTCDTAAGVKPMAPLFGLN
jgi:phosphatidylinositol-3-phosphatase